VSPTRRTSPQPADDTESLVDMSSYVTGFNATNGPLSIDRAGRVLGAGEFGPIKPDESPASKHLAAGRLSIVEEPAGVDPATLNPNAVAAFAETARANGEAS
jgi:hypothetical protein